MHEIAPGQFVVLLFQCPEPSSGIMCLTSDFEGSEESFRFFYGEDGLLREYELESVSFTRGSIDDINDEIEFETVMDVSGIPDGEFFISDDDVPSFVNLLKRLDPSRYSLVENEEGIQIQELQS